jgi:acyl-CoA dehydrogenase
MLDGVSRLVREVLIPAEEEVEATDAIPESIVQTFREFGFFGMSIPEEYGGLALSMYEEARVVMELCYASPVFRSYFGTSNGVGTLGITIDGTPEQKQAYLPRIASGEMVASFALTEPDSGSDVASISTRATKDGDHYVLNGTKRYITNAPQAGLFTVFARTGPKEERSRGISAFLVEAGTPGLTVAKHFQKMGFRGSHSSDVIFEDCRVHESALLGGREGVGFKTAMKSLDHARIHMSAVAAGMCRRIIDEGVKYAIERKQFGKPIAEFQLIQGLLSECEIDAIAARSMVERISAMKDEGLPTTKETAACKYFTTEALGRIADKVLQIHGGAGYIKEYPIERLYRDARLLRIFEGTSQIQQVIVANRMLEEARR